MMDYTKYRNQIAEMAGHKGNMTCNGLRSAFIQYILWDENAPHLEDKTLIKLAGQAFDHWLRKFRRRVWINGYLAAMKDVADMTDIDRQEAKNMATTRYRSLYRNKNVKRDVSMHVVD